MKALRVLTLLACLTPSIASAQLTTFDLTYSGKTFGNNATAVGQVTFNSLVLPNNAVFLANVSAATLGVVSWSLTVSGATTGNGSFTLADLQTNPSQRDGWVWILDGPINFMNQLVGQANFKDFNWCAESASCGNAGVPGGAEAFTIATAGETGNQLVLTSMVVSTVPEPSTTAMVLLGVAVVGVAAARRRKAKT